MEVAGTLGIGTEDSMVTEIESVGVAGNNDANKRGREWVVVEEGGAIGRFEIDEKGKLVSLNTTCRAM
jgi:hypothetical protein